MARSSRSRPPRGSAADRRSHTMRIIGGRFRGRLLEYHGDAVTRPMKDRVREAVFNLVGPRVKGSHAIDLFAGTGALALEALSRGAGWATLIERHFPTAAMIERNLETLGAEDVAEVVRGDTFLWAREPSIPDDRRWLVFFSPPYAFYEERKQQMHELIEGFLEQAPPDSLLVVEGDDRLDPDDLPRAAEWDVRRYPPAQVGLLVVEK